MLFVDGENFTIRGQQFASTANVKLAVGESYEPDVFLWLPGVRATVALTNSSDSPSKVQNHSIRSHFYTSVTGDEAKIDDVRQRLWSRGFTPAVFKQDKAKGVDIALTKDMLAGAFLENYDVAVLLAGDGDYIPLLDEVKRLGKVVYVAFFRSCGLNRELRLAADQFFEMDEFFVARWTPQPAP